MSTFLSIGRVLRLVYISVHGEKALVLELERLVPVSNLDPHKRGSIGDFLFNNSRFSFLI